MEKVRHEKDELMSKRREKEREIQKLKRIKAIQLYVSLSERQNNRLCDSDYWFADTAHFYLYTSNRFFLGRRKNHAL